MKKFSEWKLNKLGGTDPINKEAEKVYKKFDLITLPENIEGTNCFNCRFIKDSDKKVGFCNHEEIKQPVSERNCCALWDAKGAYRPWEK